ncbi:MAG TPA: ankyrin repeat domain-containing protein, partial [Pyrinomonadaceae bacterium]|nr:ankyrin repeat domain-containing protein [Pyrinomonadaceae bacterium]
MSATDLLDRIQIKEPCNSDWDSMIGNDQVRFCEHCSLTVHDLSKMTRKRARRLIAKSNGRICVRYTRRPNGSLVTKAVPQKLFQIGRRASRIVAGAFSATLSFSGAITATARERSNVYQGRAVLAYQNQSRQVYSAGTIVGTLTDPNGAVIPGVTVSLWNIGTSVSLVTTSNSEGEYRFEGLEPGSYTLRGEARGFANTDLGTVYLNQNTVQRIDKRLEVTTLEATLEAERRESVVMGEASFAVVEPVEPVVKAARNDEFLEMLAVLTRENVNARDKATGATALEHAIRNGNREMLQALISVGADVNSRNESKETVLMMLGEEATADMVWDLIHAGAKLELKDDVGDTALMEAATVNNLSVLQTLLHAGAKVNVKNDEGQTALMLAASNDMMKNVKALIAAGADMNAHDN